jgi:hypothetical protein
MQKFAEMHICMLHDKNSGNADLFIYDKVFGAYA